MTDRAERPVESAQARLQRAVAHEVRRLAVELDLAFLEADRLLHDDDPTAAAAAITRQQEQLAQADAQLRRAVADALVEREAEQVLAAAVDGLEHSLPTPPAASSSVEQTPAHLATPILRQRLVDRVPAVLATAAAAVIGLTVFFAGPRDLDLDSIAALGDGAGDETTTATDPGTAVSSRSQAPLVPSDPTSPGGAPSSSTDPPTPGSASTISPEIVELVDRVLADATSNVFEEVAQSPLLDAVEGDERQAALDLLEERLDEIAADTSDPDGLGPSESPSDPAPGDGLLGDDEG